LYSLYGMDMSEKRWKMLPSLAQLQTPLHIVLMVSPIFLLGNWCFMTIHAGKSLLLEISSVCIGNGLFEMRLTAMASIW
jgi:hypothetical protein